MNTITRDNMYKISFCTTCMNRLYHLKETLPKNIDDNAGYKNIEFVVLNYNSKDETDEWMKANMMEHIKTGRLRYIKTLEPMYFKMSHAKNVVSKYATGDIVCNLDADNFTGSGFAHYINEHFRANANSFLTAGSKDSQDLAGRVCTWKSDFLKLRGYDEQILDYGFEDTDFYYRMKAQLDRIECKITEPVYLNSIQHNITDRIKNGRYSSEIDFGMISQISTNELMEAYIFKKNKKYECFVLNSSSSHTSFLGLSVAEHYSGEWHIENNVIKLENNNGQTACSLSDNGQTCIIEGETFNQVDIERVCFYYTLFKGQMIFEKNAQSKNLINLTGFGDTDLFEPLS